MNMYWYYNILYFKNKSSVSNILQLVARLGACPQPTVNITSQDKENGASVSIPVLPYVQLQRQ